MKLLKALIGILLSAVLLLVYFGFSSEYERFMRAPPTEARVVEVRGTAVRYEVHDPGSPLDKDGDGWIGPYVDNGVPESKAAGLSPGARVVVRQGRLESSMAPPTKLLFLGVVLGLAFTAWAFVGPMLEAKALKKAVSDPQLLFELMVRKTRKSKLTAGLLLVALGCFITVLGAILPEEEVNTWGRVFLVGLGGASILLGASVLYGAWKLRDITNAPIMRLWQNERERIVWVYVHTIDTEGVLTHKVHICCRDGELFELDIAEWDPTPLLNVLVTQLPHTVFGYSAARLALYRASSQTFLEKAL